MPIRKPNRLKDYDYSFDGAYFVTICSKNHQELFACIDTVENCLPTGKQPIYHLKLTQIGEIIENEIKELSCTYKDVNVDYHVIMPNHVHMIIIIYESDRRQVTNRRQNAAPTISRMIGQWKRAVTIKAGRLIWQKSFYDRIIRNEEEYRKIWEYIDTNPQRWKDDEYFL